MLEAEPTEQSRLIQKKRVSSYSVSEIVYSPGVVAIRLALGSVVVLGVCNFVLLKVMYTAFGDDYAYFASQAVNFVYIVVGGIALFVCMYCLRDISNEERKTPKGKFFYMGLMDSLGVRSK